MDVILLIEMLKKIDKILFLLINHDSQYYYWDAVMLLLRNPLTWIPLYVAVSFYFIRKMGVYIGVRFIVWSLINVMITNSCSVMLKNMFHRLRPCYDKELSGMVRDLVDCGGLYSFPSSHATNHFGLAAFWFFALLKITGKKWKWLWIWASMVCYAQIYVGKHFPADIISGCLLGFVTGWVMVKAYEFYTLKSAGYLRNISSAPREISTSSW